MPRNAASKEPSKKPSPAIAPKWTPEELMAVRHLGPGIIGQEKYDAAKAYFAATDGGRFGPAILSDDPKYNQAGPVALQDGTPVFART